jgi:hypothetical protein
MFLKNNQITDLKNAIDRYAFPCAYFDFLRNRPTNQPNMLSVEKLIRTDLLSGKTNLVKNGLSNVIYWGYAQVGYCDYRVKRFRKNVTKKQLENANSLFQNVNGDGLAKIKKINLPEFSGMSFITKIRMFLDPLNYVILDRQILKINQKAEKFPTLLKEIPFGGKETQIRVSKKNIYVYNNWCEKCREIAEFLDGKKYRAVDMERGFFTLIQGNQIELAASILSST